MYLQQWKIRNEARTGEGVLYKKRSPFESVGEHANPGQPQEFLWCVISDLWPAKSLKLYRFMRKDFWKSTYAASRFEFIAQEVNLLFNSPCVGRFARIKPEGTTSVWWEKYRKWLMHLPLRTGNLLKDVIWTKKHSCLHQFSNLKYTNKPYTNIKHFFS